MEIPFSLLLQDSKKWPLDFLTTRDWEVVLKAALVRVAGRPRERHADAIGTVHPVDTPSGTVGGWNPWNQRAAYEQLSLGALGSWEKLGSWFRGVPWMRSSMVKRYKQLSFTLLKFTNERLCFCGITKKCIFLW